MADKVFAYGGVAIAEMTDKELLEAIRQNEDSHNYPDSATTILVAEGIKRILSADIDFKDKAAEERQKVIDETLGIGGGTDGGNE